VKVFSPRRNAPLGEAPVIPEIDKEHGLGGPEIFQPFPRPVSLFRSCHEAEVRAPSDGDIVKIPEENTPLLDEEVDKGIASEDVGVSGRLRGGNREEETRLLQPAHHPDDPVKMALSPPGIGFLPQALEADG